MVQQNRLLTSFLQGHLVLIVAALLSACVGQPELPEDLGYPAPPAEQRPDEPLVTPLATPEPAEREPVIVQIRPDTPDQYTVKKGDTLWDISKMFLKEAWFWPEVWYFNPQIENPHLIYPGDTIMLVYVDGKPQLRLAKPGDPRDPVDPRNPGDPQVTGTTIRQAPPIPSDLKTLKLSPKIRREDLAAAIPTIPLNAIQPFLMQPRIISKGDLDRSPYVVGSLDERLVHGDGSTVYVRGLDNANSIRYSIFRPTRPLLNPNNPKDILGYETILVSEAKLLKSGDPASMEITASSRETLNGDRILPAPEGTINYNFIPRAPASNVQGEIIALVDAISQSARNQVIVINLGKDDGVEAGHVLAIDEKGIIMRDHFSQKRFDDIKAPDTQSGLTMVFSAFDRLSYALIVDSTRAIRIGDKVRSPTSTRR